VKPSMRFNFYKALAVVVTSAVLTAAGAETALTAASRCPEYRRSPFHPLVRSAGTRRIDVEEAAIMSTSHRSAARSPKARPEGRSQGAKRRGGPHRRAR
jgi:hypothetical protein